MTDRYAVVGNPVAHSKSPTIHAAFARATGQAMTYERLLAPLDGFADTVRAFEAAGGKGLNVTVPFKLQAFALAVHASPRATAAGACNTLKLEADGWHADNTDGIGVVRDLSRNHGVSLADRDVLILGAGGAARGIVLPILGEKPRSVSIANRTESRAEDVAARFSRDGMVTPLPVAALAGRTFDIVLNATSAGLAAGATLPWPRGLFRPGAFAYDLVYGDGPTLFLRWAGAQGVTRMADGLGMLIEQAAESFRIWRGVLPDTAPVFELLRPTARA
ncbi:MAG: shikimate dehydrogenase [Proteobacteria bacterium]|nr:shikimate dehydrogenase [Pseudomonadota bacterium]